MAIDIDTSQPLRRPLDLQRLVQSVVTAGTPADEAFWVECKNNEFDLSGAPGRFKTARAILSFANRLPDAAATVCGGLAYVIVGAEPGKADGTAAHDGADLDNWLVRYLGGDGPVWSPTYVKHNDKDVLVIVVEPPKWGDHIHALRQAWEKFQLGTVFYRSGSVSRQANADEIRLLEERFCRGQRTPELDGLQVGFSIDPPEDKKLAAAQRAAWPRTAIAVDLAPDQVDEWIEARRARIRTHHEQAIDTARQTKGFKPFAPTTVDEAAIEDHLAQCREVLFDVSRRLLVEAGYSLITMSVTNPSGRILDHVELTLTPGLPFSAFEEERVPKDFAELPAAPKPPKTSVDTFFKATPAFLADPSFSTPVMDFRLPNQWLDIDAKSITLKMGQIRPEKTATSSSFHLLLHRHPIADAVKVGWTLTSTSAEGVQRGSIQIPVASPRGVVISPSDGLPDTDEDA